MPTVTCSVGMIRRPLSPVTVFLLSLLALSVPVLVVRGPLPAGTPAWGLLRRAPADCDQDDVFDAAVSSQDPVSSRSPPPSRLACPSYGGWRRVMQLYMSHWDVVNVMAVGDVADNAAWVATMAHCSAPLALNTFGMRRVVNCSSSMPWYSIAHGCATGRSDDDSADSSTSSSDEPLPRRQWSRLRRPQQRRSTRVYHADTVPDSGCVRWVANQHDSPDVRPADVSVYVVRPRSMRERAWLLRHVEVQASETLHAVIVYGDVCDYSGR